jgi:hypothetical protein
MNTLSKNISKSSGKIPKWLLIIGGVIVFIIFLAMVSGGGKKEEKIVPTSEKPITEVISGDIKFRLVEARDLGNILKGKESRYPEWKGDLTTEGKFIKVEVLEENVGKVSTYTKTPDIVDSQGRQFSPFVEASSWIPEEKDCGLLGKELKPGFSPVGCIWIYEVPKDATGLKLKIGTIGVQYIELGL